MNNPDLVLEVCNKCGMEFVKPKKEVKWKFCRLCHNEWLKDFGISL